MHAFDFDIRYARASSFLAVVVVAFCLNTKLVFASAYVNLSDMYNMIWRKHQYSISLKQEAKAPMLSNVMTQKVKHPEGLFSIPELLCASLKPKVHLKMIHLYFFFNETCLATLVVLVSVLPSFLSLLSVVTCS